MKGISLTVDLENPTERYAPAGRYVAMTHRLLRLFEAAGHRGTFFVVGRAIKAAPALIKAIAEKGHEIAYHSNAHRALIDEEPAIFRRESRLDKDQLEQMIGKSVLGFRAPRYSLTPQTLWLIDNLKEIGFRYSSSVMPTNISLFGYPHAPRTPFLWPNGLIEIPLPVGKIGKLRIPYLGGVYLYLSPPLLTRYFLDRAVGADEFLWTYMHPYDFDTEESYAPLPDTPAPISMILWLSRRWAQNKIQKILDLGKERTLGEWITDPDFTRRLIHYSPAAEERR